VTNTNRPAYLDDNLPTLNERATRGLGALLPPHISIRGNQFTLVDAAGNTRAHTMRVTLPNGQTQEQAAPLEALVADISDHVCKQFYANPDWTPDSNDPPDCWSANGVAPSRDAVNPQARTCAECRQNVRGSRVSKMSGAAIKACRDEVWTALILPQYAGMIFQLKITPGSFQAWRAYCELVKARADLGQIMTRVTFEPGVNGVLRFEPTGEWAPQALYEARKKALASKATDQFVGRNDVPRQGLEAPAERPLLQQGGSQVGAPLAGSQSTQQASLGTQNTTGVITSGFGAAPAAQIEQPAQRRKRRTQAEIAADNAAQGVGKSPALAPFRPAEPAASVQAPFAAPQQNSGAPFGINPNPPGPSAEIEQALKGVFGS
jgi:hypothetical protein